MKASAERQVQAQFGLPVAATPEQIANRDPSTNEAQAKLLPTAQRVDRLLSALSYAHSGVTLEGRVSYHLISTYTLY